MKIERTACECTASAALFRTVAADRPVLAARLPPNSPPLVKTVSVDRASACRFLLRALHLERPRSLDGVVDVVDALEFVQMDSINVCGRIHDLILRARIRDYRPELLARSLYGQPRELFEHYFPNLSVLPLRDYPYFVRAMRGGLQKPLAEEHAPVGTLLLERIRVEGPLRARDAAAEHGRTLSGWGISRSLAAHVLERLWLQGRLSVHHRERFERWYDLPERTLPADFVALHRDTAALPDASEERRHLVRKRLRSQRLFRPRRGDAEVLEPEALVRVSVEGGSRPWFVLAEDLPLLEACAGRPPSAPASGVALLAPLDPLVYDRERTRELFEFDYTWEVYTPVARRRWGYYVLPILWGGALVGRLDPRVDRRAGALEIRSLVLESGVDPDALIHPLAAELVELASFLGARRIDLCTAAPPGLGAALAAHST